MRKKIKKDKDLVEVRSLAQEFRNNVIVPACYRLLLNEVKAQLKQGHKFTERLLRKINYRVNKLTHKNFGVVFYISYKTMHGQIKKEGIYNKNNKLYARLNTGKTTYVILEFQKLKSLYELKKILARQANRAKYDLK